MSRNLLIIIILGDSCIRRNDMKIKKPKLVYGLWKLVRMLETGIGKLENLSFTGYPPHQASSIKFPASLPASTPINQLPAFLFSTRPRVRQSGVTCNAAEFFWRAPFSPCRTYPYGSHERLDGHPASMGGRVSESQRDCISGSVPSTLRANPMTN